MNGKRLLSKLSSVLVLIFAFIACDNTVKHKEIKEQEEVVIAEPVLKYNIPVDSFSIVTGKVKRNENLSHILSRYGVSGKQIHDLSIISKPVYDIRKIRPGKNYSVFQTKDSLETVQYFVYEISAVEYVVFEFADSVTAHLREHPVSYAEESGSGTIDGALWNCMKDAGLNPVIALELSDIYAWTVDFFGLQKGDFFKVVYDNMYVDTTLVGFNSIKYALFVHNGDSLYALPFEQDSTVAFFDSDGSSLRKAFLKAPLRFSRISSHFSHSRKHPVLKIYRPHHGIDYAAPTGTPVMTIGDGTVIKKQYSKGAGYYVKIRHNSVYTTSYLHLSKYGKGISVGSRVSQGQVIGYVGSTGLSTGPHLDFRVYKNGKPINPLHVKAPPVDPIRPENDSAFSVLRDSLVPILHKIGEAEACVAPVDSATVNIN